MTSSSSNDPDVAIIEDKKETKTIVLDEIYEVRCARGKILLSYERLKAFSYFRDAMSMLDPQDTKIIDLLDDIDHVHTMLIFIEKNIFYTKDIPVILDLSDKWGAPHTRCTAIFLGNLDHLKYIPYNSSKYVDAILSDLFTVGKHTYNDDHKKQVMKLPDHVVGKIIKINPLFFAPASPVRFGAARAVAA